MIVLHATAGSSLSGAIQALRQRELSYHYLIEKSGQITKAVNYGREAFHAGNSFGPEEELDGITKRQIFKRGVGWIFAAGTSVNAYSIGISFVNLNDGKDPYTAAQIDACRELIATLKAALPLKWLTTHFAVSPGRKSDPKSFRCATVANGLKMWGCK